MEFWYGLIVNGAVVVVKPFLEDPDVSDFEYATWPGDKYEIVWMGLHWTGADGHNHVL